VTTDLVPRDDTSAEIAVQTFSQGVQRLIDWADAARAAHTVAQSLVTTSFVPEAFRGKSHEATAAILSGAEVGLSPMGSLKSFDIINGTAAPRALTLRAIVQSLGHEIIIDEQTDTRCKVRGRRRGSSEWQPVTWTIDRAQRLGLTGKTNWKSQPQAMLVARATSEVARLIAADAILGIPYSVEEIEDSAEVAPSATVRRSGTTRTVERVPAPQAEEPALDEPPPAAPVPSPEPPDESGDGITSGQLKKIGAGMRDQGITARPDALAYVARVIGREVESRNDLTKAEAHQVIEALEFDAMGAEPAEDPS
jgi:hypothetical protein